MFLNLYSIYDNVAEVFNKPFSDINDASAIRAFSQSVEDNKNKDDYTLYHIGGFDDNSGSITADKSPKKLRSGFEIKTNNVTSISEQQQLDDLAKHEALKKQSGI